LFLNWQTENAAAMPSNPVDQCLPFHASISGLDPLNPGVAFLP
jgi:hypothetical protein